MTTTESRASRRIYQIGFNKTATVSLHIFFVRNQIPSVHWDHGNLSKTVISNYASNRPLFTGYEQFSAFSDMEHRDESGQICSATEQLFREMHAQDPDGLFIFNIRPLDEWLRSRSQQTNYLEESMRAHELSAKEILAMWRERYENHCQAVRDHFGDDPRLLEFDISRDDGATLAAFLARYGTDADPSFYGRHHRTVHILNRERRQQHIDNLRDAAIYFAEVEGELEVGLQIIEQAIELRPLGAYMQRKAEQWRARLK